MFVPELSPGPGFFLEGDGQWDVREIPPEVLESAEYFGEIEIEGFPSVVFTTPEMQTWAQKAPGVPAPKGDEAADAIEKMAMRVAGIKTGG